MCRGVMSGGVMIKMGIYGIFRVVLATQSDLLIIGVLLLAVSLISGLLGGNLCHSATRFETTIGLS